MTNENPSRNTRTLREYLERARIKDRYSDLDLDKAKTRLTQRWEAQATCPHQRKVAPSRVAAFLDWPPAWTRPEDMDCAITEVLQGDVVSRAWWDLTAVSLVVTSANTAEKDLHAFIKSWDQRGALVFACLLHLAGDQTGARFWWQFAFGGEDGDAAYLLFLDHTHRGEYRDARQWADQVQRGFTPAGRWGDRSTAPSVVPLPATLTLHIGTHLNILEDPDLGPFPVPQPDADLSHELDEIRHLTRPA